MKRLLLMLAVLPLFSMTNQDIMVQISNAMNTGNAKALSQFFANEVEMTILDDDDLFTKAQAEALLKQFFANQKPKNFKVIHEGNNITNKSKYFIGNLATASGSSYRVYLYMRTNGNALLISEMRINES